jgi:hypothetical protein
LNIKTEITVEKSTRDWEKSISLLNSVKNLEDVLEKQKRYKILNSKNYILLVDNFGQLSSDVFFKLGCDVETSDVIGRDVDFIATQRRFQDLGG